MEIILQKLPAQDSREYRYLRDIAGDIAGESLVMSRAEVWSVDTRRADMLLHAADEQGVEATLVDANTTMLLEPGDKSKGPSEASIGRMQSSAVTGVSMMKARLPALVEYAMARGEKPMIGSRPMRLGDKFEIEIPLGNGKTIGARRSYVETTKEGCFWHGQIVGSNLPVSLMWWPDGSMAGSFMHDGRNYMIRPVEGAHHAVLEIEPERLPPPHPVMPADMRDRLHGERLENLRDARGGNEQLPDGIADLPLFKEHSKKPADIAPKSGDEIVISVLFLATKRVEARYTNVRRELAALAIEQTNQSFRSSKVKNVRAEIADLISVDLDDSKGNLFNHLWAMVDQGDGILEEVHRLRDKAKADIVILLVDNPSGCGLATRVAAGSHEAFATVHHECATTTYSVAHEIGHLIGARHDRSLDKSMRPFPFGHGYVHGTKWRTMMSYKSSCEGCPRLPIWSSPRIAVKGQKAGDEETNNARVIAEQAARVAGFR